MKPELRVTTVECDGALRIVAEGELDLATAHLLNDAILAAEATRSRGIVLDIDAVSFIDSSGLHVLLEAYARSQRNGNRLQMTRGTAQAQRLFALVGVDDRLPFVDPAVLDRR